MSVPWGLTTVIARRASFIIKLLIGIGIGHNVQGKDMGLVGGTYDNTTSCFAAHFSVTAHTLRRVASLNPSIVSTNQELAVW